MGIIRVVNFVSLDGVVQSVLSADEDTDGGFTAGGWVSDHMDDGVARFMADATTSASAMLLGRRSYQSFASIWPYADQSEPPVAAMNRMPKYVVSRTLTTTDWHNSTILQNPEQVTAIKDATDRDIVIFGSSQLLPSLFRLGLIDQVWLVIFPLVIGSGKRMFPDGGPALSVRLTASRSTSSGVVLNQYRIG